MISKGLWWQERKWRGHEGGEGKDPRGSGLGEKRKTRRTWGLRGRKGLVCVSGIIQGFGLPVYPPHWIWVLHGGVDVLK